MVRCFIIYPSSVFILTHARTVQGNIGMYYLWLPGLIQACAGAIPTYMVLDVAEVLWEFISFCREVMSLRLWSPLSPYFDNRYFILVFTKSVHSNFSAFWLAPVTWNIVGYSLFCERRKKWRVVSRKFQKKKLWPLMKRHFFIHLIW